MKGSTRIEGSVALVTGASRGIGRAITEALLERGAVKVYATARDPKTLNELAQQHGPRVVALRLDVTDADQVAEAARHAPDVDLLINNAGLVEPGELVTETTVDVARREMEVNYFGPLRMLQRFAYGLSQRGGDIEKSSPQDIATGILDGVEAGDEDIFPGAWAVAFAEQFNSSPKDSERQAAAAIAA